MTRTLCTLVVLGTLTGVGFSPAEAEASVKGKTYNVSVTKNATRNFDDFYNFQSDGKFISVRGGVGTWSQINLLVFSVWAADFQAGGGSIRVSFVGIQVGSQITAVGNNTDGDVFRATGNEGPFDGALENADVNDYIP